MTKNKPYTLYLRFEDFEDLWTWAQKHLPPETALYKGFAIDPEFRGIGRAPANSVIVRLADDPYRQEFKLTPKIVAKKTA